MLRNHELKNTLEKNKQQFLLKIKELIDENKDYNFRLLQINKKKFYEKLIQGQNLLNFINIDRSQVINRKDFNNNVDKFFESLNEEEYKKIKNLYDLNHNKKYNTLKEITDYRSKLLITKKILNETFNIEILYNKNKIKILEFNFNFWSNFYNMYNINKVEDSYLFK
jgi:Zn-dependent metalloprotease